MPAREIGMSRLTKVDTEDRSRPQRIHTGWNWDEEIQAGLQGEPRVARADESALSAARGLIGQCRRPGQCMAASLRPYLGSPALPTTAHLCTRRSILKPNFWTLRVYVSLGLLS